MRIQCIVLENHGNIPVLRFHVIHQFPINIKFSGRNILPNRQSYEVSWIYRSRSYEIINSLSAILPVKVFNRYKSVRIFFVTFLSDKLAILLVPPAFNT